MTRLAAALLLLWIAAAVAILLLRSGGQGRWASSVSQSPRPTAALALSTATLNCDADVTLDGEEVAFFQALNAYRASLGAPPLRISSSLERAASWKARDLADRNYFSHTDSLGRDPFAMQADCGYTFNTWRGETLAAGTVTAGEALRIWQQSPPHDAILRDGVYTAIGVARAYSSASSFGWYWAAEFGGFQEEVPPACPDYYPDGRVTIQDIIAAYVVPVYRLTLDGRNYDARYDRNNDGQLNSLDMLAILRFGIGRSC